MEKKDKKTEQTENKDGGSSWTRKIVGIVGILVFLGYVFGGSGDEEKTERTERKQEKNTQWKLPRLPSGPEHHTDSKAELLLRTLARIQAELDALGIDGAGVVKNAKNPKNLFSVVPEHKRPRLLLLSREHEETISQNIVEAYRKAGLFADKSRPEDLERIRGIVGRLVRAIPEIDRVPEVHLVRDEDVNACCFPDGTVFVNTGTLEAFRDDDELAGVLAHELGHAAARHGNERLSRLLLIAAGAAPFENWLEGLSPWLDSDAGVPLVHLVYGVGSSAGVHLPVSRKQESEADRLGTRYLARAGFAPDGLLRVLRYFDRARLSPPKILERVFSTHPVDAKRIERVEKVLQEPGLREMPEKKPPFVIWKKEDGDSTEAGTNRPPRIRWTSVLRRKKAGTETATPEEPSEHESEEESEEFAPDNSETEIDEDWEDLDWEFPEPPVPSLDESATGESPATNAVPDASEDVSTNRMRRFPRLPRWGRKAVHAD